MLLEVIVQSVADAEEAEAGGADRLEVVREIERDGLTPPLDLVRSIVDATSLPLRVMVRESDGFGITGPRELIALQRAFADLADLGVHGAVVGFARDGALDLDLIAVGSGRRTRPAGHAAPGVRFGPDPEAAIDAALGFPQIDRILTSGGSGAWTRAVRTPDRLVAPRRPAHHHPPRRRRRRGGAAGARPLRGHHRSPRRQSRAEPQLAAAPVSAARVRRLKSLIPYR